MKILVLLKILKECQHEAQGIQIKFLILISSHFLFRIKLNFRAEILMIKVRSRTIVILRRNARAREWKLILVNKNTYKMNTKLKLVVNKPLGPKESCVLILLERTKKEGVKMIMMNHLCKVLHQRCLKSIRKKLTMMNKPIINPLNLTNQMIS